MALVVQLSDLLATSSLDLRLLGGDPEVDVHWVATSELDDPTPFLEGFELLLTTGLRVPRGGWARWVDRLVDARVAGVGFGVGLSHRTVPRTLTEAARAAGLPLLEVPVPTPFIAISRRLADLLRRSENEAEAAAARTQSELAAAAARPDGILGVLQLTARAVGGSAWLLDADGTVRAGSEVPPAQALEGLRRVRTQGARASWADVTAEGTLTLRPTGTDGRRWLLARTGPGVPRAAQATLGTAAALLGLLSGPDATSRSQGEVLACVVDLVVSGRLDVAQRLAEVLEVRLPDPVVVVRWDGTAPPTRLVGARHALLAPGASTGGGPVGVGRPVPLAEAAGSARSADLAFARVTPSRPVVHAAGSLPDLLEPDVLRTWADARLAPLAEAPDGADLRTALHAFLTHHGARQPTAEFLGVHRNTLRHRLSRCEGVLGAALDDPTDRSELWLALTAAAGPPGG